MAIKVSIVALPGTLCSPIIFKPTESSLADAGDFEAVSWMSEPGPWSIPEVARRVSDRIKARYPHPVVLIGHSTGGAIAAYLTAEHPGLVRALVLVNTGAHTRRHGDVDKIIQRFQEGHRDGHGDGIRRAVVARSFADPPADDVLAGLMAYADAVPSRAVAEVLQSQRGLDLSPLLARISCPTVVLHGVRDKARSRADAEELAGLVPGSTLHWVECGHTPVFEDPEVVAAAVREVLERVS